MSKECTPVLSGAIPSFEMFMVVWEQLGENHPHLAGWTDIGIEWATVYYRRMDESPAYVIAMCELIIYDLYVI
jgi:hypothetical protein